MRDALTQQHGSLRTRNVLFMILLLIGVYVALGGVGAALSVLGALTPDTPGYQALEALYTPLEWFMERVPLCGWMYLWYISLVVDVLS